MKPGSSPSIAKARFALNDEEKLILFTIGSLDQTPIRSKIKIQKILFLISNVFKGFQNLLEFEPHLFGPYSETLDYVLESLIKLGLVKKESSSYLLTDDGQNIVESLKPKPELINVINDFNPDLAAPTKDSKYRLFLDPPSPFCTVITNRFSFIFPLSSDIRFINSTVPEKISGTSFTRTIRIFVNSLNTRHHSNRVLSMIELEFCSIRKK